MKGQLFEGGRFYQESFNLIQLLWSFKSYNYNVATDLGFACIPILESKGGGGVLFWYIGPGGGCLFGEGAY